MDTERAPGAGAAADDHARRAHDAVVDQALRHAEPRLSSEVACHHRLVRPQHVGGIRGVRLGDGAAEDPFLPTHARTDPESLAAGQPLQHPRVFRTEGLRRDRRRFPEQCAEVPGPDRGLPQGGERGLLPVARAQLRVGGLELRRSLDNLPPQFVF